MIILSGQYKGIKIKTARSISYRPTQTRIRKSLYDMLGDISQNKVLDLFAGSGILGFEAASRGADSVTFVENNLPAIRMLQQNVSFFKHTKFDLHKLDAFGYLKECDSFNLILADPPYGQYDSPTLVDLCLSKLTSDGVFVLETRSNDASVLADREKKYGDTKLLIWRKT